MLKQEKGIAIKYKQELTLSTLQVMEAPEMPKGQPLSRRGSIDKECPALKKKSFLIEEVE